MKHIIFQSILLCTLAAGSASGWAQQAWRCPGNYYTNDPVDAKTRGGCTVVEGGSVSVVPSTPPRGQSSPEVEAGTAAPTPAPAAPKPAPPTVAQRRLQAQITQVEQELAKLEAEYNNGEPQRMAVEWRNIQMYMQRTERLKNEIEQKRVELQGLQTKLNNLPEPGSTPGSGSLPR